MQITLRKETKDMIAHLQGLPWLMRAGDCSNVSVKTVKTFSHAKKHLHQQKFNGLLTEFINRNQAVRCRNPVYANQKAADANFKANLIGRESDALVDFLMDRFPLFQELDARSVLSNHVDGFITEVDFDQKLNESPYRSYILPWYESGHLPCGWDGKLSGLKPDYNNWVLPEGRLIVW